MYSMNRITFRYPASWRLLSPSASSLIFLYSPDFKDDGGIQIQKIQQGARITISQTDLPQKDLTAENYGSNGLLYQPDATDGKVVVINGRRAFQFRQPGPRWFDSTVTIFFRDDGTRVEVAMEYPSGHPAAQVAEYDQLLASLAYQ
jgi:hypothetical protein